MAECVIQVVDMVTAKASAAELDEVMKQLVSHSVCYVTSVSQCAVAQMSGANAKFWMSLEQRSLDVLDKVSV